MDADFGDNVGVLEINAPVVLFYVWLSAITPLTRRRQNLI
jgi:hypothetical protein